MPNAGTKLLLFVSSYAPLWAILALRNWDQKAVVWSLAIVALLSSGGLYFYTKTVQRMKGTDLKIDRATPKDADVLGYLVAYLLPFLDLDFSRSTDVAALLVFIAVIGLLYSHSNLIYVNPLFAAWGYHLYDVSSGEHSLILLSKRRFLPPGETIKALHLGLTLRMEKIAK